MMRLVLDAVVLKLLRMRREEVTMGQMDECLQDKKTSASVRA